MIREQGNVYLCDMRPTPSINMRPPTTAKAYGRLKTKAKVCCCERITYWVDVPSFTAQPLCMNQVYVQLRLVASIPLALMKRGLEAQRASFLLLRYTIMRFIFGLWYTGTRVYDRIQVQIHRAQSDDSKSKRGQESRLAHTLHVGVCIDIVSI